MNYQIEKGMFNGSGLLYHNGKAVGLIADIDFIYPGIATIWVKRLNIPGMRYVDVKFDDISVAA